MAARDPGAPWNTWYPDSCYPEDANSELRLKSFIRNNLRPDATDSSSGDEMSAERSRDGAGQYSQYTPETEPLTRSDITKDDAMWSIRGGHPAYREPPPYSHLADVHNTYSKLGTYPTIPSDSESEQSCSSQDTMILKSEENEIEFANNLEPLHYKLELSPSETGVDEVPHITVVHDVPVAMRSVLRQQSPDSSYRNIGKCSKRVSFHEEVTTFGENLLTMTSGGATSAMTSADVRDLLADAGNPDNQEHSEEQDDGYESTDNLSSGTNSSTSSSPACFAPNQQSGASNALPSKNSTGDVHLKGESKNSSKADIPNQSRRLFPSFRNMNNALRRQLGVARTNKVSSSSPDINRKLRDLCLDDSNSTVESEVAGGSNQSEVSQDDVASEGGYYGVYNVSRAVVETLNEPENGVSRLSPRNEGMDSSCDDYRMVSSHSFPPSDKFNDHYSPTGGVGVFGTTREVSSTSPSGSSGDVRPRQNESVPPLEPKDAILQRAALPHSNSTGDIHRASARGFTELRYSTLPPRMSPVNAFPEAGPLSRANSVDISRRPVMRSVSDAEFATYSRTRSMKPSEVLRAAISPADPHGLLAYQNMASMATRGSLPRTKPQVARKLKFDDFARRQPESPTRSTQPLRADHSISIPNEYRPTAPSPVHIAHYRPTSPVYDGPDQLARLTSCPTIDERHRQWLLEQNAMMSDDRSSTSSGTLQQGPPPDSRFHTGDQTDTLSDASLSNTSGVHILQNQQRLQRDGEYDRYMRLLSKVQADKKMLGHRIASEDNISINSTQSCAAHFARSDDVYRVMDERRRPPSAMSEMDLHAMARAQARRISESTSALYSTPDGVRATGLPAYHQDSHAADVSEEGQVVQMIDATSPTVTRTTRSFSFNV